MKINQSIARPLSVKFGWVDRRLGAVHGKKTTDKCMDHNNLEKLTERLLAKLHPSNLVNTIFYLVF